mmetsp:Transcript_35242/g.101353  ORF Transcript_35242/g.101353 Transcript_35242/m.101353 type:complete len:204 (+) Transcript_35242:2010-2621(+)
MLIAVRHAAPFTSASADSSSVLIDAMAPHSTSASRSASVPPATRATSQLAGRRTVRMSCASSSTSRPHRPIALTACRSSSSLTCVKTVSAHSSTPWSCSGWPMWLSSTATKGAKSASGYEGSRQWTWTSSQAPMRRTGVWLLSRSTFSSGSRMPAASTSSRCVTDPPAMWPRAQIASPHTSSTDDDTSWTRGGMAPASTTAAT